MRNETQKAFTENQTILANLTQMVQNLHRGKESNSGVESSRGILPAPKGYGNINCNDTTETSSYWSKLLPKVDLPMFEGDDPRT